MAVFIHPETASYALVSFKALYSRFTAATSWNEVATVPTPRHLARVALAGSLRKTFYLVRNPYKRTVSCFMDKYRKQPGRIECDGFEWQNCHTILHDHLGITPEATDAEKAAKFLAFSFDDFIELLPQIYHLDAHFMPQCWSNRLWIAGKPRMRWPFSRLLKIEDTDSLSGIPGIDFSLKTNTTGHINRDFELNNAHKKVIHDLYRQDFGLGGYEA